MAIEIDSQRIRTKAKLDDDISDTDILATIDEVVPYIESRIKSEYITSLDETVQSVLRLGAMDIVIGEMLKEYANDEEMGSALEVGPIKIGDNSTSKKRSIRAQKYIDSGWKKLKPYLKSKGKGFYFSSVTYE